MSTIDLEFTLLYIHTCIHRDRKVSAAISLQRGEYILRVNLYKEITYASILLSCLPPPPPNTISLLGEDPFSSSSLTFSPFCQHFSASQRGMVGYELRSGVANRRKTRRIMNALRLSRAPLKKTAPGKGWDVKL